mmetsp:Transcript_365/g.432  ORF Transcript_365/g.432 Transcript_365/m.432 type:complete len:423 (+) Transcript_365:228-1496(+)|eukprot:CAMPEP_0184021818 /NCGR_PEP_ID=MMETSP0954-20121128/10171_1 /TAXON_ID=627963 /ORGANISM="Aplanochytrium sp, Strain PBS07" /LENGTH=422 /DNA_ID=CAMNT_0026303943 /DNA_START=476 /DNA_END=1744 /DNA_ORIENTATION=-
MSFTSQTDVSCCSSTHSAHCEPEEKNCYQTENTCNETHWGLKDGGHGADTSTVVPYPNELLQPVIPRVEKHRTLEIMEAYDEVLREYPTYRGCSETSKSSLRLNENRPKKTNKYDAWQKQAETFTVRDSSLLDGTGKGLYTTHAFKRGDLMFAEKPLLCLNLDQKSFRRLESSSVLHDSVSEYMETMTEDEKQMFDTLVPDATEDMYATDKLLSSLIPCKEVHCEEQGPVRSMLLSRASHINHSCTPSVQVAYNQKEDLALFFATREIKQNEELTIAYVHPWQNFSERKEILPFQCCCLTCMLPEDKKSESDQRRNNLRTLFEQTSNAIKVRDFITGFSLVDDRIRTLKEEGLDSPRNLMSCSYDAFYACRVLHDLEGSLKNLKEALEYARGSLSEDEGEMKTLLKDMGSLQFHLDLSESYD